MNIRNYDLYLFDLDGTLINTEELHWKAYNLAFSYYNIPLELTYYNYCKYAHYDDNELEKYVTNINNNNKISYQDIYQKKKEIYLKLLDQEITFTDGAEKLLELLILENIPTCIVTHSDKDILTKILSKCEILNKISKIITKNDYINKKPHPECYIKALNQFPYCQNPIGFEDSFKGYKSLEASGINCVYIGDSTYVYYNEIKPINSYKNFNDLLKNGKIISNINNYNNYVDICIDRYSQTLLSCKTTFNRIIKQLIPMLNAIKGNIYLTGVGKCGYICRKSVSTWQSVNISCHYLNIAELFHGEFGILKPHDLIIYISKSGNTEELIKCCNYIKNNFKSIIQICLTIDKKPSIKNIVNYHYNITDESFIYEIDTINMAPTTSSLLFLTILDMIGIKLSEEKGLTIEKFKIVHPGGELGKIKNNIIDYVFICAGGKGTRLFPITKYVPKMLINYKNEPFIQHMIKYWQKYCKKIIILCDESYNELINFYTKKYFDVKIINCCANGTAEAIDKYISKDYYNMNILITWCDILPEDTIDLNLLDKNTIFTYGNECRYALENNKIIKLNDPTGNIIGIYYIKKYSGLHTYKLTDDICDVYMNNFTFFKEYKLTNLIDIGDMIKLRKYNNNNLFQTRFFNEIILSSKKTIHNEDIIIKKSIHEMGNIIIQNEIEWYKNLKIKGITPQIYSYNDHLYAYEMELLNAIPLYKKFKLYDQTKQLHIINQIINNLKLLHESDICLINSTDNVNNLYIECYEKIITRISSIKPIIEYIGTIKYVNNIEIFDIDFILLKCFNIIKSSINNNYYYIHGDCQFSNILYDDSVDKLYFIDPRGCFGKSMLYGPKEYDFAKILYALSGYDSFNNNQEYYISNIDKTSIQIDIENFDYLYKLLPKEIYNQTTMAFVVIIWISLAQYNLNDVNKCISSYYYGLYLYSKYFT